MRIFYLKFLFWEYFERSKPQWPEQCHHNFLSATYFSVHPIEKCCQLFLLQENNESLVSTKWVKLTPNMSHFLVLAPGLSILKMDHCWNPAVRLHPFWNFSGRGITGISIPNSTYFSSNGTEIILFMNKSPKSFLICYHCSSYSCSSSYSSLRGGIDRIHGILFQFYLILKNVAFHLLFSYSTSAYS